MITHGALDLVQGASVVLLQEKAPPPSKSIKTGRARRISADVFGSTAGNETALWKDSHQKPANGEFEQAQIVSPSSCRQGEKNVCIPGTVQSQRLIKLQIAAAHV